MHRDATPFVISVFSLASLTDAVSALRPKLPGCRAQPSRRGLQGSRFLFLLTIAAAFLAVTGPAAAESVAPYNRTVETVIQPQTEQLLLRLVKDGRDMKLGGVTVFNGDDKFLPGKIALGLADFLTNLPKDDPRLPGYLEDFGQIARMTVNDDNEGWGIYYYLSALNALRKAGELNRAVDPATLARLRVQLDWRSFVDVRTFKLINLPNNYYCVAFGAARLRMLMGWEDASGAEILMAKMLEHYREYSGVYGFADETDGDGRFDRYSILLSGEITQRFLQTGSAPPPEVLGWLRKSADVMLLRLNTEGEGFEYGRSLGPYADTSMVEVLTAAAVGGVLTPQEKDLAYAFVCRVARRYVTFWMNKETGSVDLWDQGRRTDAYRGKFRILGENFSLAHQFLYTNAAWNALGYKDKPPMADFDAALDRLPARTVTWFARGVYDRMLLTIRDKEHVIGLPLINGAHDQHMHNPYFPIPYSNDMLSSVADGGAPLLIPRLLLTDGSVLQPLAYFQNVNVSEDGDKTIVTYSEPQMDRMGKTATVPDDRLSVAVTYVFSPGRITRTDVYTPKGSVSLAGATMEFATYSDESDQKDGLITFAQGAVRGFSAEGFRVAQSNRCAATMTTKRRPVRSSTKYRAREVRRRCQHRCASAGH